MRVRTTAIIAAAVLALAGTARPIFAQSLADVAKKEEERRKTIKNPSKVLTSGDLKPVPVIASDGTAQPAADQDSPKKAGDAKDAASEDNKDAEKKPDGVKDQKYWTDRQGQLQS